MYRDVKVLIIHFLLSLHHNIKEQDFKSINAITVANFLRQHIEYEDRARV